MVFEIKILVFLSFCDGVNVAVFKWNNFRLIKANEIKFSGLPTSHVTLLQNTTLNANKTKITEGLPTNAIFMTFLCIEITIFMPNIGPSCNPSHMASNRIIKRVRNWIALLAKLTFYRNRNTQLSQFSQSNW